MRALIFHRPHAQVDTGLAEVNGVELGMAIRHVQQRHITEGCNLIQSLVSQLLVRISVTLQPHACDAGRSQHLQKFAFGKAHINISYPWCCAPHVALVATDKGSPRSAGVAPSPNCEAK